MQKKYQSKQNNDSSSDSQIPQNPQSLSPVRQRCALSAHQEELKQNKYPNKV